MKTQADKDQENLYSLKTIKICQKFPRNKQLSLLKFQRSFHPCLWQRNMAPKI